MLPCRLPALLLNEAWRLLLAVDGREESPVPCLSRDRGAPTEAERILSFSNDLELDASGVLVRPRACRLVSFFLGLFDGKGGKAQSWLSSSGDGGRRRGAEALRGGWRKPDRARGLMGEAAAELLPLLEGVSSPLTPGLVGANGSMRGTKGLVGLLVIGGNCVTFEVRISSGSSTSDAEVTVKY